MDQKFNSILSISLVPQIINLIIEKECLDDLTALSLFYQSKVYSLLSNEETKMWHYSPMTVYMMWKHEKETGMIVFPED